MGNFQDLLDKFGKGKEAAGDLFNMLLNRRMQNLGANDLIPSQMPGAMGGGFDHGITGNLSDIQSRPIDYGVKGGLKQMPYMYGDQTGGIQQMPYRGGTPTLTEFGQGLEALKKAKERGVMNDSTYEALQMLQGY